MRIVFLLVISYLFLSCTYNRVDVVNLSLEALVDRSVIHKTDTLVKVCLNDIVSDNSKFLEKYGNTIFQFVPCDADSFNIPRLKFEEIFNPSSDRLQVEYSLHYRNSYLINFGTILFDIKQDGLKLSSVSNSSVVN